MAHLTKGMKMQFISPSAIYALLAANAYGATNNSSGGDPLVRSERNTLPLPSSDWVMIAERVSTTLSLRSIFQNRKT
jgi:hypothetical protein